MCKVDLLGLHICGIPRKGFPNCDLIITGEGNSVPVQPPLWKHFQM